MRHRSFDAATATATAIATTIAIAILTNGCGSFNRGSGAVTGTISYRERIALPENAAVEVRLTDVTRQDVTATIVANSKFSVDGRQVPIPFELRYNPREVLDSHIYVVRAAIRAGGRMLFATDTAYPVLTQGKPSKVDLILVRVADAPAPAPDALWGTSWLLKDIAGASVPEKPGVTLEFPERGKIAGSGSCNRFFGTAEVSAGGSIAFGALGSTKMACPEPVSAREAKYFNALQKAERFSVEGSTLLIWSKGIEKPLRFSRAKS